ncbi:MAG: alpha/beta fold hydrolase [Alphaproteobacteria bacterium]
MDAATPWTIHLIEANGLAFETAVMGTGEDLVLCLHGFPETYFSWRHQMPVLAEAGYTVWAPNLRGYGGSSRPKGVDAYRLPTLIEDVAGLYDAAVARGHRPKVLMAHDWGGVIAWFAILRRVRPFERFIVINIPHPACARAGFLRGGQILKSWYMFFFQLPWLPERLLTADGARAIGRAFTGTAAHKDRFPPEAVQVFRENALIPGAMTAMLNYYRALLGRSDLRRLMAEGPLETDIPTLMIWGENDMALGLHLTEGTGQYVSNLTFRPLPGISHWAQQDDPNTVNALISEWLDRSPPSGG